MRVLLVCAYTRSLVVFRMDLIDEMVAQGHEVYALGPDPIDEYREVFNGHRVTYRSYRVSRTGVSPFGDMRTQGELRKAMREIAPDVVFTYNAKAVVYGCTAARRMRVPAVYALIAGLGSVYRGGGFRNRLIKFVMRKQYRRALDACEQVFFQNNDDRSVFVDAGLVRRDRTVMLRGSGVNLEFFSPAPYPECLTFLFVGRLLRDKGIVEYLEACSVIRRRYPWVRCHLVGPHDSNPSALDPAKLDKYVRSGAIEYLGEQEDVRPFIAASSVFVLPSYHEGTPRSVLEAMSMGRPVITTDAPGCRETVVDGVSGFLVEPRDIPGLVERMENFINNPSLIESMGARGRRLAEDEFDVRKVNAILLDSMQLFPVGERG